MPDRLNVQPVVFLGLTDSELRMLGLVNLAIFAPMGAIVGAVAGALPIGLGAGVVLAVGGIWLESKILRRMKRGKPEGYHTLWLRAWLQDHGLGGGMLRIDAVWDIRAHEPRGREKAAGG